MNQNSLISAALFSPNSLQAPNAWVGHLPFAAWLIKETSPKILVELGTHSGNSYFSFCQSVLENNLSSKCYAVDTWQGDEHAGRYDDEIFSNINAHNQEKYAGFSRLLRMTFDDAVTYFADGSINLLHIDGLHTYETVRHDFDTWLPKLAPGAVVIFHDTNVRERNFGVWKLWEELQAQYPLNVEFVHSHGLGVLQIGNVVAEKQLSWLFSGSEEKRLLVKYFASIGTRQLERCELIDLRKALEERDQQIVNLNQVVAERDRQIANFNQAMADRDRQIANFNQAMADRDEQIVSLSYTLDQRQEQISAINNSTSWRITSPLRKIKTQLAQIFLKRFRNAAVKKIRESYRNLSNGVFGLRKNIQFVYCLDQSNLLLKSVIRRNINLAGWLVNTNTKHAQEIRIEFNGDIIKPVAVKRKDIQNALGRELVPSDKVGFLTKINLRFGFNVIKIQCKNVDGEWNNIIFILVFHLLNTKPNALKGYFNYSYSYQKLISILENQLKEELLSIDNHIKVMIIKPKFGLIITEICDIQSLETTLVSLELQLYQDFEIYLTTYFFNKIEEKFKSKLKIKTIGDNIVCDFLIFLPAGNKFSTNAIYEFASSINMYPSADLVYGDEDFISDSGLRANPFYKPGWSPDYLEAFNYIGFTACYRKSLSDFYLLGDENIYDFILKFTERTNSIVHIPKIIGTSPRNFPCSNIDASIRRDRDLSALQGRLSRTNRDGIAYEDEMFKGCYHLKVKLKTSPLVSIIIPTAGNVSSINNRKIDLICNVVMQIRELSTYKNIEIIVVDGGELTKLQLDLIDSHGCKRVKHNNSNFNFSKSCNLGASISAGEFLLFLNDDIEILTPSWIERLLEQFEKPHVGMVGAKLLYPDGKLQHVGVVHNWGCPDHVRDGFPGNESGYFYSTCGDHNYQAVTGACFVTKANIFYEVGGYSEELAVSFNDTDLCMKIGKIGLSIVYASRVVLTHMTSQSRSMYDTDIISADQDELNWYQTQWALETVVDPFYNGKFLDIGRPTFTQTYNSNLL